MGDVLDIAAEELRRAGLRVGLRFETLFRVSGRAGRSAAVLRRRKSWIVLLQGDRCVAEYAVTKWTPRHTETVRGWIEDAVVDGTWEEGE